VSSKGKRISAMAGQFQAGTLDPHYAGYFELFNRGKFFEAHEVLEHLWLKDRPGVNGSFYKGLIQLAGAFVHLQRNHLRPAAALFKLAQTHFEKYPSPHERLNLAAARQLIDGWLVQLEKEDFKINPLTAENAPRLTLQK
jgi:predicted metal-dependent hydrolase